MPYKDPEKRITYGAEHRTAMRAAVQTLFGNICNNCGCTDRRVLEVDHIFRAKEPKKHYHRSGMGLWRQILRGHKPISDFQLLCRNCNFIKVLDNHEHRPIHKIGILSSQGSINA